MDGTILMAAGTAVLSGLAMADSYFHRRNLRAIPIRVHVNGTRGKSGVTRLIAAGLRAGGIRTCAKTTGTLPRMIMPDGAEYPVFRPGRANIMEQRRIVQTAVRMKAEALVIECMALQPNLQSICELKLVQATHGVITNARADHMDVMGPDTIDVAKALAGTVPVRGQFFTAEQKYEGVFRDAALDRQSDMTTIGDDDIATISWDELERFPYIEHPDNVALALRVCASVGIDRQVALEGMWAATPDPGVMTVYRTEEDSQRIAFVNGFAANDPESTGKIWEMIVERFRDTSKRIAVINCRADRADRSEQLAESCVDWTPADHYLVMGTATNVFRNRALDAGLDAKKMTCLESPCLQTVVQTVRRLAGDSSMVMGMGNIAGPGMKLVRYFHERQMTVAAEDTFSIHDARSSSVSSNVTFARAA